MAFGDAAIHNRQLPEDHRSLRGGMEDINSITLMVAEGRAGWNLSKPPGIWARRDPEAGDAVNIGNCLSRLDN